MLETFTAMERLLAQPELAFFTNYRDDFFERDRAQLLNWGAPEMRFLWIVRENGTHLVPVGVCAAADAHALAALDYFLANPQGQTKAFWVQGASVRGVALEAASMEIRRSQPMFEVQGPMVLQRMSDGPMHIAALNVIQANSVAGPDVVITARSGLGTLQLSALALIATMEAGRAAGSLLVTPRQITVNGQPIAQLINGARNRA